jgi:hypothetical protein
MELCSILLSWIVYLSDFERVEGCPELRMVSHEWLEQRACGGRDCKVLGWYPGSGDVVYLDGRLDLNGDLHHASIALHEIVHWLQGRAGALLGTCTAGIDAERQAYAIQQEYLVAHGRYLPTGTVMPMLRCAPVPSNEDRH